MIIKNKLLKKPTFWSKSFLNEFEEQNSEQTIATLLWHKDEKFITGQIEDAIRNKVDIIISEILLDELPESVMLSEYEFLSSKLLFVPPHCDNIDFNLSTANKSILIFSDKEFEYNPLSKLKQFEFCKIDSDLKIIVEHLECASKVIINTNYQQLNHFIILWCINQKIPFVIDIDSSYYSRYPANGISLKYNTIDIIHCSLRQVVNLYLKNGFNKFQVENDKFIKCFFGVFNCKTLATLSENLTYKFFIKDIYETELSDDLWKRTWNCFIASKYNKKSKFIFSRYRRKFIFSIIKYVQLQQEDNFDTKIYLKYMVEYLLQQKPSSEWKSELNLLFVNFPEKEFQFEGSLFELESKGLIDEKTPYLHIIIEEIIFASNDKNITPKNKILLLNKAKYLANYANKLSDFKSRNYNFLPSLLNSQNSNSNQFIDNFISDFINSENKNIIRNNNILKMLPTFYNVDIIIEKFKELRFNEKNSTALFAGVLYKYNISQMYNSYFWDNELHCQELKKDIQYLLEAHLIKDEKIFFKDTNNLHNVNFEGISEDDLRYFIFLRGSFLDRSFLENILKYLNPSNQFSKIINEILQVFLENDSNKIRILDFKFRTKFELVIEHPLYLSFNILNSTTASEINKHLRIAESHNYYHHNILKSVLKFIKID